MNLKIHISAMLKFIEYLIFMILKALCILKVFLIVFLLFPYLLNVFVHAFRKEGLLFIESC